MDDLLEYHRQNDHDSCGPACAQMVLDYLVTNLMTQKSFQGDQSIVKSTINPPNHPPPSGCWAAHYVNSGWITRPDELREALETLSSEHFSINPGVESVTCYNWWSDDFRDKLKEHLDFGKLPIVPVHGIFTRPSAVQGIVNSKPYFGTVLPSSAEQYDAHWIILFKYRLKTNSIKIKSFTGCDPWLASSLVNVPLQHAHGDNCANKKVYINIDASDDVFGVINFPYRSRIAIVQGDESLKRENGDVFEPEPDTEPNPEKPRKCRIKAFNLAMKSSLFQQLADLELLQERPINQYLRSTLVPGPISQPPEFTIGTPRLVQRLDGICRDYYLVPFLNSNGESKVIVRVDAHTGRYLDSLYNFETPLLCDQTQARTNLVQAIRSQLQSSLGDIFIEQINRPATKMVWLPCVQSLSAFFPFYVIEVGPPNTRFLVRLDGTIFQELRY